MMIRGDVDLEILGKLAEIPTKEENINADSKKWLGC